MQNWRLSQSADGLKFKKGQRMWWQKKVQFLLSLPTNQLKWGLYLQEENQSSSSSWSDWENSLLTTQIWCSTGKVTVYLVSSKYQASFKHFIYLNNFKALSRRMFLVVRYGLGMGGGGVHVFLFCIWFWCWCAVLGPPLRCPRRVGSKRIASTLCSDMLLMQENVGSPSWKGTCNSSQSVRGGLAEEWGACIASARAS